MSVIVLNPASHAGKPVASLPREMRQRASQTELQWRDDARRSPSERAAPQRWSYLKSIAFIAAAGVFGWLAIIGLVAPVA